MNTTRAAGSLERRVGDGGEDAADRERRQEEAVGQHLSDTEDAGAPGSRRPNPCSASLARHALMIAMRRNRAPCAQLTSARAKSPASNGRRSSSFSPIPISLTGIPSSAAIASAIPPFAVPSSLVSTRPLTLIACANSCAWRSPFWPVVASTVSSVSCGASGICLRDHALDLRQLRHQVVLRVQAPGGVDDHDVGAVADRRADRLEGDRAGIGVVAAAHELARRRAGPTARAARPPPRGTCRRRPARRAAQLSAEVVGELAGRRGLPRAVDARHQDDGRLVRAGRCRSSPVRAMSASSSRRRSVSASPPRMSPAVASRSSCSTTLAVVRRADIGVDQRLLEPLPALVVELFVERRLDLRRRAPAGSCAGSPAGAGNARRSCSLLLAGLLGALARAGTGPSGMNRSRPFARHRVA